MPRIDAFLKLGREQGCSDIHFTVGLPLVRLDGELTPLKCDLTSDEISSIVREVLDPPRLAHLDETGSVDFSYSAEGAGRFRVNACKQHRGLSAICRVIPEKVPTLAELGLPPVISRFTGLRSGMVLVTGAAGTGKSTTLPPCSTRSTGTRTQHHCLETPSSSCRVRVPDHPAGDRLRTTGSGTDSGPRSGRTPT
jgi:twitching motility protein PilT